MRTPAIMMIDEAAGPYPEMRHSDNWRVIRYNPTMAEAMQWVFRKHPQAQFYGWLSDDLEPRTPGWDVALIETAGEWFMAHCNDLHLSGIPQICMGVLSGAMCWGGELVRTVGWWALPGVRQGGIDDAWVHMFARLLNLKRYRPDVVVEHMTYLNGKRPRDATDNRIRDGVNYIDADLAHYWRWRHGGEPERIVQRVVQRMMAAGYDLSDPQFVPILP
jgi:hypothetical protein